MTDTQHRNFLGIPVKGTITTGEDRKNQRPLEDFQPILQAMLDDPTIIEFGWRQYTPYFNDGDPCLFHATSTWVRTTEDGDDPDPYDLELWGKHPSLGKVDRKYSSETQQWEYLWDTYEGPDVDRFRRVKALEKAVEGGEFENVLLAAFGDHAAVTVRRDGIEVEFYSHD